MGRCERPLGGPQHRPRAPAWSPGHHHGQLCDHPDTAETVRPLIGQGGSRDLNTGLWLAETRLCLVIFRVWWRKWKVTMWMNQVNTMEVKQSNGIFFGTSWDFELLLNVGWWQRKNVVKQRLSFWEFWNENCNKWPVGLNISSIYSNFVVVLEYLGCENEHANG